MLRRGLKRKVKIRAHGYVHASLKGPASTPFGGHVDKVMDNAKKDALPTTIGPHLLASLTHVHRQYSNKIYFKIVV